MGRFATFLLGGAVGVAAGLLLSPRSGAENRALISDKVGDKVVIPESVQEKAGQIASAAASTSTKVINTVVDNGSDAIKNVKARAIKANPTASAFTDNGDELRQKIDAARERIATQVAKNAEAARDAAVDKIPVVVDAAMGATQTAKHAAQSVSDAVQNAGHVVADAASKVAAKVTSKAEGEEAKAEGEEAEHKVD